MLESKKQKKITFKYIRRRVRCNNSLLVPSPRTNGYINPRVLDTSVRRPCREEDSKVHCNPRDFVCRMLLTGPRGVNISETRLTATTGPSHRAAENEPHAGPSRSDRPHLLSPTALSLHRTSFRSENRFTLQKQNLGSTASINYITF